ncbi:hypothetical protein N7492_004479 [Penicillium capsulatum]|uniref:Dihydrofolate reductase n=1 Tax=Penicillium capsulatum TaxID=69766 RepID=A0A9W9IAB8_9EURO|nr:hypothetical protein N7492_004479 [Penicillium capsulatum]KAJ6136402.1 hypothetical protein N7512_001562 [Penicillium capsulatum]
MPPPTTRPLTLIVATTPIRIPPTPHDLDPTPRLGIGLNGTLPWPRIKTDMSFFARTTSRAPSPGTTNAIIMGRKTYESVPMHLRPLAKRISVVISRDTSGALQTRVRDELDARKAKLAAKARTNAGSAIGNGEGGAEQKVSAIEPSTVGVAEEPITHAMVSPSLETALQQLEAGDGYPSAESRLGKIYVIGGAEIYGAALRMSTHGSEARPVRIVMTNVVRRVDGQLGSFECDTFFPLDGLAAENGWRAASAREVSEWVGEEVSGEWQREGEVEVQMVGYERLH